MMPKLVVMGRGGGHQSVMSAVQALSQLYLLQHSVMEMPSSPPRGSRIRISAGSRRIT